MFWLILSTYQFHVFIDWSAVALNLTGSLALIARARLDSLVLLLLQETIPGGEDNPLTVTVQVTVLLVPLVLLAFTLTVWIPDVKPAVMLL